MPMQFTVPTLPWWFYAAIAVPIVWPVIQLLIRTYADERRYVRAGLSDIKKMHWRDFEKYLGHLFRSLGYQADVTSGSGDYGVDVILTDSSGRRTAVQAKHWRGRKVGAVEIQKTIGGAAYYKCQQMIVVTLSGYTNQAREMARETGVQLWGLQELGDAVELAKSRGTAATHGQVATSTVPATKPVAKSPAGLGRPRSQPEPKFSGQSPKPLGVPVKPGAVTVAPLCPQCGSPMVERTAEGRPIWLCSRFPACKGNKVKN